MTKQNVIVIGSGVAGLTSALKLLNAGHTVTIYSKEAPGEHAHTSDNAWATWWPTKSEADERVERWSDESLAEYLELSKDASSGVALRQIFSLQEKRLDVWYDTLPFFRHATPGEIADHYGDALVLDKAPVINPTKYLTWLYQQVAAAGATFVQKEVTSLDETSAEFDAVVNCTALGARSLTGDQDLYSVRLQVLRIKPNGFDKAFFDDSGPTAIVAHDDHIRIGSLLDQGDESLDVDEDAIEDILKRVRKMVPGFKVTTDDVLSVTRVLRPERSTIRVEKAALADGRTLIHNYGHDGLGYITSLGIANEVASYLK